MLASGWGVCARQGRRRGFNAHLRDGSVLPHQRHLAYRGEKLAQLHSILFAYSTCYVGGNDSFYRHRVFWHRTKRNTLPANIFQQQRADGAQSGLKVVYTPLNGTGNKPVRRILKEIGVKDVIVVPEQENPDGNFPTCPFPNPEITIRICTAPDVPQPQESLSARR